MTESPIIVNNPVCHSQNIRPNSLWFKDIRNFPEAKFIENLTKLSQ